MTSQGGRGYSRPAILIVFLCVAASTAATGILQLLYSPYLSGYGYTLSSIGGLFSLLSVFRLVSRVPTGVAYHARHAGLQIVIALAALGLATSGFALARGNPFAITLLTAGQGLAFGAMETLLFATIIDLTGGRHAGAVMGWFTAAISTGYMLGGFGGGWLGDSFGTERAFAIAGSLPLAGGLLAFALPKMTEPTRRAERVASARDFLAAVLRLDTRVWLAFTIVLYINALHDGVDSFFPLFGPTVGLSLAAVGALKGIKPAAATVIRFVSGAIFYVLDYRSTNVWAIIIAAAATVVMPWVSGFPAFAALFLVGGLTRGILRVTSAIAIAELRSEGKDVGLASGVYSAGLDLGGIIGPAVGGIVATAFGIPVMFQVLAVGCLAGYFAVALSSAAGRASLRLSCWQSRP